MCFALSEMHLASYSWAQARLGDLGGAKGEDVLHGRAAPCGSLARVDPGRRIGDLIGTYRAALYLLTERFVEVLRLADLSGYVVLPVRTDGPPEIATLFLLQVTGACGSASDSFDGQTLDPSTWDGSDFFAPPNRNAFYLSERAAETIQQARLRNVQIGAEYFRAP